MNTKYLNQNARMAITGGLLTGLLFLHTGLAQPACWMAHSGNCQNSRISEPAQANPSPAPKAELVPMDQNDLVAGKQYQGDGLAVAATPEGAWLRCVFQRLEGEATSEGLWMISTVEGANANRFRVKAVAVEQEAEQWSTDMLVALGILSSEPAVSELETWTSKARCKRALLPAAGSVAVDGQVAKFFRPGLVEEYRVSMDGVRQDFVVTERPGRAGQLRVGLDVTGAKAEPMVTGVRLVLEGSGREIAYSRLRVTDATGRELTARIVVETDAEVAAVPPSAAVVKERGGGALPGQCSARLVVLVDDIEAVYPVRIDPTFSDVNWISMGDVRGVNWVVRCAVFDAANNLYIGGEFTSAGNVIANHVAKWNGSSWSPLGSGVNNTVYTLAILGTNLYVGGDFTMAGDIAVNYLAKWDGKKWSALGQGSWIIGGSEHWRCPEPTCMWGACSSW